VDWIRLAQGRIYWQTVANTAVHLRVPQRPANVMAS
jgi:hypothetical protein